MNRKLIDLTLLECFKKKFEKMFDKKLEVMNTEVEKRFGEVNANLGDLSFIKCTQAEYDAMESHEENTVYLIKF